jgi:hypothetical protein
MHLVDSSSVSFVGGRMKEPAGQMSSTRRTFLKTAVAAGGVSVLSTANVASAEVILQKPESAGPEPADGPMGYHETAHIKHYYKTLRE